MTYLLDINGVMALLNRDHESHDPAHAFFARRPFATCPLIQLGALRLLTRPRLVKGKELLPLATPAEAWSMLTVLRHNRARVCLPDDLDAGALKMPFRNIMGHRQWNDFYLAALAQKHGYMLATFDVGLQTAFPEVVKLIPR